MEFIPLNIEQAVDEFVKIVGVSKQRAKRNIISNLTFLWGYSNLCNNKNWKIEHLLVGLKIDDKVLPFLISPDMFSEDYCLVQPLGDHYKAVQSYKNILGNLYKPVKTGDTTVAQFPLLDKPKEETFKDFIMARRKDYSSVFFGAKSKKVGYELVSLLDIDKSQRVYYDVCDLWINHTQQFRDKFTHLNTREAKGEIVATAMPWEMCPAEDIYLICAKDLDKDKYIGAMYINIIDNVAQCGVIAVDHSIEYKPYSLVISLQYVSVREVFYNNDLGIDIMDFGINFADCADYKKAFTDRFEPLYNLDSISLEQAEAFVNLHKGEN